MSFRMLAFVFASLYALIFRYAELSAQYLVGLILCFVAVGVFASKSEEPAGDRAVMKST